MDVFVYFILYFCRMNLLVKLVNEWDTYSQQHPSSAIEDFCRFYLIKQNHHEEHKKESCPEDQSILMKIIAKLSNNYNIIFKEAMLKTSLPFPDAFYYLNTVFQNKEMKKTELIQELQLEYTTGMEGMNKLLKAGFITEKGDEKDKRVKKIAITQSGQQALYEGYSYMGKIGKLMFGNMKEDVIRLCIQLLQDTANNSLDLASNIKSHNFDDI